MRKRRLDLLSYLYEAPIANERVCWLATEQDEPPEARAHFEGPPCVLTVGRTDAREGLKGHDELIACRPEVVAAVPNARLVVGGGTGLETLKAKAAASFASATRNILGHIAEKDLPAAYRDAHVYATPSRQGGFGIAYVEEKMRFGLPVIASFGDAGQEINVDGVTGYTIAPRNARELRKRLVHLLRGPTFCAALGTAGFERWRTYFRYSYFARRFLDIWRDFARGGVMSVHDR